MQTQFGYIMSGAVALALLASGCSVSDSSRSVSGTIETDEVRVASRYGGRVEKTLAMEGDSLKAGQLIAELDAAELAAKRDQAAAQLHKELAALGPEAVHVNLGPNNPRTQALYQASRELAKRKVN